MEFKEQYQHPKWQKKRLEILERDEFKCVLCNNSEDQLQVHHKFYFSHLKVWEYKDHFLVSLCDGCHALSHDCMNDMKETLSKLDFFEFLTFQSKKYNNIIIELNKLKK